MINQKVDFENPETEIKCEFGEAIRELQISKLLTKSNIKGKNGKSFYEVFQFLLLLVFQNCNLYHFLNSKKKDTAFSKNTYYRFLNNASFNWVKFISPLDLGSEFQGLSYDMTVSSTAIVFTRYILIEWLRRKKNDDKTICELFYLCCDDIQDMEFSTALKQLLEILVNGLKNQMITITSEIKSQLINWFVSQPAFIQALCPDFGWEV